MSFSIRDHAVFGGVFFSAYQLLEQMAVGTSAYLVNRLYHRQYISPICCHFLFAITHRRVKVDKDRTRDVFAISRLGEKGLVRAALADVLGHIGIYLTIGQQAMFAQVTASSLGGQPLPNRSQSSKTYSSHAALPNWAPA
jgi:hypothetical protein